MKMPGTGYNNNLLSLLFMCFVVVLATRIISGQQSQQTITTKDLMGVLDAMRNLENLIKQKMTYTKGQMQNDQPKLIEIVAQTPVFCQSSIFQSTNKTPKEGTIVPQQSVQQSSTSAEVNNIPQTIHLQQPAYSGAYEVPNQFGTASPLILAMLSSSSSEPQQNTDTATESPVHTEQVVVTTQRVSTTQNNVAPISKTKDVKKLKETRIISKPRTKFFPRRNICLIKQRMANARFGRMPAFLFIPGDCYRDSRLRMKTMIRRPGVGENEVVASKESSKHKFPRYGK